MTSGARRLGLFICVLFLFPSICMGLTQSEQNIIGIHQEAAKSLVNISSITVQYDFFYRPVPREGSGSGMVIDRKGHILTNNHVIKNAQSLEVKLWDGSQYRGTLVGAYPDADMAVIRIDAPKSKLHPIPLGKSSNLQVGQTVIALGNPFGLGETLTTGVISSLGRSIQAENGTLMEGLIQTDASINPGNSGGPLLDSSGRVIGINTAILSPTGASIGIGFAVPVDIVKRFIPDLIQKGYVAYPFIGLSVFPVFPGLAEALDLKTDYGAMVVDLVRRGPAARQGIKGPTKTVQIGNAILPIGGDVIVGVDGEKVTNGDDFVQIIARHRPGDKLAIRILRNGKFKTVNVVLGEKPRKRSRRR